MVVFKLTMLGGVYTAVSPFVDIVPADGLIDHLTAVFVVLATVAASVRV
jgi:hypothetical protein